MDTTQITAYKFSNLTIREILENLTLLIQVIKNSFQTTYSSLLDRRGGNSLWNIRSSSNLQNPDFPPRFEYIQSKVSSSMNIEENVP